MKVILRNRRTAFDRDGHPCLKCHPDGSIQANKFGKADDWEEWTIHTCKDGKVAFQSWTGKYLSAKPDGSVRADAKEIDSWEKWATTTTTEESDYVSFRSHHGKYLVCDDLLGCGQSVRANPEVVNEWEEWAIVNDPHALTVPGSTTKATLAKTLVAVGSVVTLGALAIPLAGFGVAGVGAGSLAAATQSVVYGGATCGVFSFLQSVGATMAWVPIASSGAVATAAGAGALAGKRNKSND